ncbi:FAD-dependent oxidoreductase, partial [Acidianus sp. RZ1]|uniref:FAD-dependent oxidoreductase n=1 Tax=Acidianus sp. RZ1 TaxID=1540082 RepID=UPI001493091A|nr:FAD-dependent oxidoreductase [Acidianus sp. RZ1]
MMKVLVLGGGAAGMSSSSRVRKLRPNAEIVVYEETNMVSHAPCGVPYYVEGLFNNEELFMTYTPEFFREKRKIDVRTGYSVEEIDLNSRVVKVRKNAEKKSEEYDYLIIALGAKPKKVRQSGSRIFYAHHPAQAKSLRDDLWTLNKIAIIGGGILGVEMAEALHAVGKKVTLIQRSSYVLNKMLDSDMAHVVTDVMSKEIDLRLNERVESIEEEGKVIVTDKGKLEVDGVVVTIGVEPNISLLKDQLKIGETGAIWVDETMKTNKENVYAAGDNTETRNIVTGKPTWMPFAPVANKMGFVAGSNIGGKRMEFPGTVGTMITKYDRLFIGKVG